MIDWYFCLDTAHAMGLPKMHPHRLACNTYVTERVRGLVHPDYKMRVRNSHLVGECFAQWCPDTVRAIMLMSSDYGVSSLSLTCKELHTNVRAVQRSNDYWLERVCLATRLHPRTISVSVDVRWRVVYEAIQKTYDFDVLTSIDLNDARVVIAIGLERGLHPKDCMDECQTVDFVYQIIDAYGSDAWVRFPVSMTRAFAKAIATDIPLAVKMITQYTLELDLKNLSFHTDPLTLEELDPDSLRLHAQSGRITFADILGYALRIGCVSVIEACRFTGVLEGGYLIEAMKLGYSDLVKIALDKELATHDGVCTLIGYLIQTRNSTFIKEIPLIDMSIEDVAEPLSVCDDINTLKALLNRMNLHVVEMKRLLEHAVRRKNIVLVELLVSSTACPAGVVSDVTASIISASKHRMAMLILNLRRDSICSRSNAVLRAALKSDNVEIINFVLESDEFKAYMGSAGRNGGATL